MECHRSSKFLTAKVFTVYFDKNTIYSVGSNPERKKSETVFHDGKGCTSLTNGLFSDQRAAHSA